MRLTINGDKIEDASLYCGVQLKVNGHFVGLQFPDNKGSMYFSGDITTGCEYWRGDWYFTVDLKSREAL